MRPIVAICLLAAGCTDLESPDAAATHATGAASGGANGGTGGREQGGAGGATSGAGGTGQSGGQAGASGGLAGTAGSGGSATSSYDCGPTLDDGYFSQGTGSVYFWVLPTVVSAPSARVSGISGDGSVVVGTLEAAPFTTGASGCALGVAFRWSVAKGQELLAPTSFASAADAKGGTVVGGFALGPLQWRDTAVSIDPTQPTVGAYDINADGTVLVGHHQTYVEASGKYSYSHTWRSSGGVVTPLPLDGAYAVSGDGLVVVGTSGPVAGRWSEADGLQAFGYQGSSNCVARGANLDGTVVVGSCWATGGFVWRKETGARLFEKSSDPKRRGRAKAFSQGTA